MLRVALAHWYVEQTHSKGHSPKMSAPPTGTTVEAWLVLDEAIQRFKNCGAYEALDALVYTGVRPGTQFYDLQWLLNRCQNPVTKVVIKDALRVHLSKHLKEAYQDPTADRMLNFTFGKFKHSAPIDAIDLYLFDPSYFVWLYGSNFYSNFTTLPGVIEFIGSMGFPNPSSDHRQSKEGFFCWDQLLPIINVLHTSTVINKLEYDRLCLQPNSPPFSVIESYRHCANGDWVMAVGKHSGCTLAMIHAVYPSYIPYLIKNPRSESQLVQDKLQPFYEDVNAKFPSFKKRKFE